MNKYFVAVFVLVAGACTVSAGVYGGTGYGTAPIANAGYTAHLSPAASVSVLIPAYNIPAPAPVYNVPAAYAAPVAPAAYGVPLARAAYSVPDVGRYSSAAAAGSSVHDSAAYVAPVASSY